MSDQSRKPITWGYPTHSADRPAGLTDSEQSDTYSAARIKVLTTRGTRRLHLNTSDVWRVREYREDGDDRRLSIVRERDGTERIIRLVYWLGDSWGRPRSRAGARS